VKVRRDAPAKFPQKHDVVSTIRKNRRCPQLQTVMETCTTPPTGLTHQQSGIAVINHIARSCMAQGPFGTFSPQDAQHTSDVVDCLLAGQYKS
jgi:hypothetical protein